MNRLADKVALVTGGRQGIGRGIVDAFIKEGATVIACGRGDRPADLPADVGWQKADVSDRAAVEALRDRVVGEFGRLSTLATTVGS